MRVLSLLLVSLLLPACPTAKRCDVTTCASGCCDATGTCQLGDAASACGSGGALCVSCAPGYCSALRQCGSNTGSTGGGGGSATGGGGGTGGRTVVFTNTWHQLTETGESDVNYLGDAGIAVFVANGTTLTEVPGTRTADRYTAQNVPTGEWVLRNGNTFFVTSSDTLNRGSSDIGRDDAQRIDAGVASLTLAVAGLPAWSELDNLEFFSVGAGLYGYGANAMTSGPTAGMVPSSFTFDYGRLRGSSAPRVSAAKGDSLYVAYLKSTVVADDEQPGLADDGGTFYVPFECSLASSGGRLTMVEIVPGPNAAALTFSAPSPAPVNLKVLRNQFVAREAEVHPDAYEFYEELYVVAEPIEGSVSADLVTCFHVVDTGFPLTDLDVQVNLASPFPATWQRATSMSATYAVSKNFPDAGTWYSRGTVDTRTAVGAVVAPGVHSPTNLTVQGVGAAQVENVSATSPVTVSWARNAQGVAATDFRVELVRITKNAGSTTRTTVALALTRGTTFTFPAGFLVAGQVYFVRVSARVTTSPESAPYAHPVDSAASAITSPFIASPQ